jgi:hypothetical protein
VVIWYFSRFGMFGPRKNPATLCQTTAKVDEEPVRVILKSESF